MNPRHLGVGHGVSVMQEGVLDGQKALCGLLKASSYWLLDGCFSAPEVSLTFSDLIMPTRLTKMSP